MHDGLKIGDALPDDCTPVDHLVPRLLADDSGVLAEASDAPDVTAPGRLFLAERYADYVAEFEAQGLTPCNDNFASPLAPLFLHVSPSGEEPPDCTSPVRTVPFRVLTSGSGFEFASGPGNIGFVPNGNSYDITTPSADPLYNNESWRIRVWQGQSADESGPHTGSFSEVFSGAVDGSGDYLGFPSSMTNDGAGAIGLEPGVVPPLANFSFISVMLETTCHGVWPPDPTDPQSVLYP